jgi:hypothetical protein
MFETENRYYEEHKQELREKYLNKHVVIQGTEIKGVYDNDADAFSTSIKTMKPGTFVIKCIKATDEEEIIRFMSRVYA